MKNRTELAKYFAELGFTKGAEIGVCSGYYSKVLLDSIPDLELISIDEWKKSRYIKQYEDAISLLSKYSGSTIIKGDSIEESKKIEDNSLDFVFIDACHCYDCVKKDIAAWTPKVLSGGIVSGHDYYKTKSGNMGVINAVDEYVKKNGYTLILTEWDKDNQMKDDRQPSWYFIKE